MPIRIRRRDKKSIPNQQYDILVVFADEGKFSPSSYTDRYNGIWVIIWISINNVRQ
jgi:hypothetical protein